MHYCFVENFELISPIEDIENIAVGSGIRDLERLRKTYGSGRWRKLKGRAFVRLEDGFECEAELHWYEAHGIGFKGIKDQRTVLLKAMKTEPKFAVCIENKNYPASLEFSKIYRVIEDEKAAEHQMLRVRCESGEDYLYSEKLFAPIKLPQIAGGAFMALA